MAEIPIATILVPTEPHNGTCGYCGPPDQRSKDHTNSHRAECNAVRLSCDHYQRMIDRGWRRSGTYCYRPDLRRSCCPQYTIKLDASDFKPSKSQRKLISRFNRYVVHGAGNDDVDMDKNIKRQISAIPTVSEFSIHDAEKGFLSEEQTTAHEFTVTLEESSYTDEKFELYEKYQKNVHHEDGQYQAGFMRFLVNSPLQYKDIPYASPCPEHLPEKFGSYHQLYRIDGQLIAMGVLDILPTCVSSVYFMYDTGWEKYSLGKLSALREIALAREINKAGYTDMKSLYMGFYIHSCQKMRYKGEYQPSFLADPEDYTWHSFEKCRPLLDKYHYAAFSHPEHSLDERDTAELIKPDIPEHVLSEIRILVRVRIGELCVRIGELYATPLTSLENWRDKSHLTRTFFPLIDGLGFSLAKEIFYFQY